MAKKRKLKWREDETVWLKIPGMHGWKLATVLEDTYSDADEVAVTRMREDRWGHHVNAYFIPRHKWGTWLLPFGGKAGRVAS